MDLADIGSAIATKIAAVTPPTGYSAIQFATHKRQKALGKLPAVIVEWGATRDLNYYFGRREGMVDYLATFYYPKAADEEDTDAALQAWHDVLADALLGQVQLDEWGSPNGVRGAYIRSLEPGEGQVGEPYYATIEISIEVDFDHAVDIEA